MEKRKDYLNAGIKNTELRNEIFCTCFYSNNNLVNLFGECMKLYGKTLMFRRGKMLNINLLYECNLTCTYCSLEMPTGIRPKARRVELENWKEFIEK